MSELPKHLTLSHKSKAQVSWQPFWACFYQGSKVQMLLQFPWLSLYTYTRDIFFSPFSMQIKSGDSKNLNYNRLGLLFSWGAETCEWAGQTNVMQLQHPSIWQNRWCWGKGEAVRSTGTWKIMNATNLLSITGSYFDEQAKQRTGGYL